jgi:hypothetical protein
MPQQIYEVEIDGKVYELEGDRPPTEQEAREAVKSFAAPAPSMPSLHEVATSYPGPQTEDGRNVGESDFFRDLNMTMEGSAHPWNTPDDNDKLGRITDLFIPVPGGAAAAAKAGPAVGKKLIQAGKAAKDTASGLEHMSPLARTARHTAAAGVGHYLGGNYGMAAGAAMDVALPKVLDKGGDLSQKFGRFLKGTTALDEIPTQARPRLVKSPADPLADALMDVGKGADLPESVSLPEVPETPTGGWTKDASGSKVYTSDVQSGRHDIPGRNPPRPFEDAVPKAAPAAPAEAPAPKVQKSAPALTPEGETISIGGQKLKAGDPLLEKVMEAMGADAKPAASHGGFTTPRTPQEWAEARRMYGSRDLARMTGKTREEVLKLAPGPSRVPTVAEERIRAAEARDKPFWSRD